MTNIIDIYFDSVGSTATAPSKLWQWSKGQVVRINGLDLPTVYQVHFSNNPTLGTAEPVAVSGNMVSIPDIYLTTGEPVYMFIWLSDETSAETIRKGTIYVAKRSQPSGAYDPTAEQQTIIDGLIGSINTAVATAEGYANSAQTYSGNAATSATEALNAKDAAQGYAEQASQTAQGVEILVNRAEDAADDAETAKQDVEQLKQAVEGFADDAESAKTDAETARGEAQGFATTASAKASEASQSASQASQSANTATEQAQTATAKATEASQSAETATAKATEASASATTASTKASEASTSASTATTAKNDAVTAKNAAVTAKTGAETARNGAEAAAQSIEQSAAQIATNTSDIADLKEDLDDLTADVSEIQSDGIVPTARQLLSDKYAVDQTPYKYRASYSGDRMNDEIVGGSIVWNQLVQNGNFSDGVTGWRKVIDNSSLSAVNNELTITETTTGTAQDNFMISQPKQTVANHKYLVAFEYFIPSTNTSTTGIRAGIRGDLKYFYGNNAWVIGSAICTVTTPNDIVAFSIVGQTSKNDYFKIRNVICIDLTTMFGTEVADAIYAMEQAEAGAGVAWFKNLFPNDYYEYSEPTLKHVEGLQKHEMVGFNLFDRSQASENKALLWATGVERAEAGSIASPYMRVKGGERYYSNYKAGWLIYDAELNYIGAYNTVLGWNKTSGSALNGVTLPNDAVYLRLALRASMNSDIDMTKVFDICINLSDPSRNGEYEPYVKHTYPLDNSLTLRGIPKIDVGGNLYYDGDTYESDGTVTRKYGIVDLGTLNWSYVGVEGAERFFAQSFTIKPPSATSIIGNVICPKYIAIAQSRYTQFIDDKIVCVQASGLLVVRDTAYTDTASFKTAMSGVMLVYELATPTTETAQPYQNPQIVDANGTEEYVSTSIVPIGHYTKYYDDLRKKLDGLPWNLDMIAPEETGTTARQAYAIGKYFILDNQLCKAKTAIASGATFTLNTNYEVTTVADELYTALHA